MTPSWRCFRCARPYSTEPPPWNQRLCPACSHALAEADDRRADLPWTERQLWLMKLAAEGLAAALGTLDPELRQALIGCGGPLHQAWLTYLDASERIVRRGPQISEGLRFNHAAKRKKVGV